MLAGHVLIFFSNSFFYIFYIFCSGMAEGFYRVKMSLVTAAMLYSSRRAWHNASIRAVFPDPTGLFVMLLVSLIEILMLSFLFMH